jgi:hypothetical protein
MDHTAIRDVFLSLMGVEPRVELVGRWSTDITNGTRSLADLHRYIMRTREYDQHVAFTFKRVYIATISEDPDATLLPALVEANRGVPITEEIVACFLRSTDAFAQKHAQIIKNMWSVIKGGAEIDSTGASAYLSNFTSGTSYTIHDLQDDIFKDASATNSLSSSPLATAADVIGTGATLQDYERVIAIMASPRLATELYIASKDLTKHPKLKEITAAYPAKFGRDLTVVELLRIFPSLLAASDVGALVGQEASCFNTVFTSVAGVYQSLLEQPVDHMFFIKNHLTALDAPNLTAYTAALVDALVHGDEYAALAHDKIRSMHEGDIGAEDLQQIFAILVVGRTPLSSQETVENVIADYFRRMDAFVGSANKVFQDNLSRDMDADEVASFRRKFRDHSTDMNAVETDVRASFEFTSVVYELVKGIAEDLAVALTNSRLCKITESLLRDGDNSKLSICLRARQLLSAA